MTHDPRIEELLEDLLNSGGKPEDVCRERPELLPRVRAGWQRFAPSRPSSSPWWSGGSRRCAKPAPEPFASSSR